MALDDCLHPGEAWAHKQFKSAHVGIHPSPQGAVYMMLQGSLGARFPECLEEIMLGRVKEGVDEVKRDTAIIRKVLKKLLVAVRGLHSLGECREACPDHSTMRQEGVHFPYSCPPLSLSCSPCFPESKQAVRRG